MQWLDQLPFADNRVVQMGFLAACGIAALVVLAILYRLVFAHRLRVPGGRTRQPRLGLVDAFTLDGQRQLVLVRRDNVEHLVMIGGPNDVVVESQINRALTPVRENNQGSPLLAPSAPTRRTETPLAAAPVVAEAPPSKVAAPAAASAPPAPKAPAPLPAPAAPKASSPASVPAVTKPAAQAPAITPAPAAVPAPAAAPAPAAPPAPAVKPVELEPPARAASIPVSAPRSPEPVRQEPASSPSPRAASGRPTMPPPIVPASGSANRATVTRLTEKVAPRSLPIPANPPPAAAAPSPPRPDKAEPAAAVAGAASAPARLAPKTLPFDGAQKFSEIRQLDEKLNAASSIKGAAKVDDPFADLDSLEAEMARLLGRAKLN